MKPNIVSDIYAQGREDYKFETAKQQRKRIAEQKKKRTDREAKSKVIGPGIAAGPTRTWSAANPRKTNKVVRANFLRDHPTDSEALLAVELRKHPALGLRPSIHVYGYIADYYSERLDLVVELDGCFHNGRGAQDRARDKHLLSRGIRTLRFPSSMVFTNLQKIVETIWAYAESRVDGIRPMACGNPAISGNAAR